MSKFEYKFWFYRLVIVYFKEAAVNVFYEKIAFVSINFTRRQFWRWFRNTYGLALKAKASIKQGHATKYSLKGPSSSQEELKNLDKKSKIWWRFVFSIFIRLYLIDI